MLLSVRCRGSSAGVSTHPHPLRDRRTHRRRVRPTPDSTGPDTARFRAFLFFLRLRAASAPPGHRAGAPHGVDLSKLAALKHLKTGQVRPAQTCGRGLVVGLQISNLNSRVRFPASAPIRVCPSTDVHDQPRERRALCAGSARLWCSGSTRRCTHRFPRSGTAELDNTCFRCRSHPWAGTVDIGALRRPGSRLQSPLEG